MKFCFVLRYLLHKEVFIESCSITLFLERLLPLNTINLCKIDATALKKFKGQATRRVHMYNDDKI